MFGEARLLLIQIAGQKFHGQQAAPFQIGQQGEQRIAVFAPGQAYEPFGALFDHGKIAERLASLAQQTLAQFFEGHARRGMAKHWMAIIVWCAVVHKGLAGWVEVVSTVTNIASLSNKNVMPMGRS